jgi:hypothetical protein
MQTLQQRPNTVQHGRAAASRAQRARRARLELLVQRVALRLLRRVARVRVLHVARERIRLAAQAADLLLELVVLALARRHPPLELLLLPPAAGAVLRCRCFLALDVTNR